MAPGHRAATGVVHPGAAVYEEAPEAAQQRRVAVLKEAVLRALTARQRSHGRCDTAAELAERLNVDGVDYEAAELPTALERLEEEGLIRYGERPQPTAF